MRGYVDELKDVEQELRGKTGWVMRSGEPASTRLWTKAEGEVVEDVSEEHKVEVNHGGHKEEEEEDAWSLTA